MHTKRAASHRFSVFGSPWKGVFCTQVESDRHYGRHSHATYGVGFVEHGAQRSASGRGRVDAYAGDVITTNPGEVHDGEPLGGPSRRWRMLYLEPAALAALMNEPGAAATTAVEITRPVIQDTVLRRFEKTYGLPPHAWLVQERAERARRLIRAGGSLALAAASAGFADQSHMSRVFLRHFGFTPGAWKTATERAAPQ